MSGGAKTNFLSNSSSTMEDLTTGSRNSRIESFDATDLLSEMDRNELIKALNDEEEQNSLNTMSTRIQTRSSSKARAIPVPQQHTDPLFLPLQQPSAASSQGSSGSAFLSSVLNPSFGSSSSILQHQQQLLSHTPPFTGAPSSYETKHFGKRTRSGSVSGRLRSASEYLEEKGLLDRQTKGILKDLIIIGDEELQQALDSYEMGDPSSLEEMIKSGALQNRLPQDLDILGDLDLDFLTMDEDLGHAAANDDIEGLSDRDDDEDDEKYMPRLPGSSQHEMKLPPTVVVGAHQLHLLHQQQKQPNKVSPPYDDGIGELEFAGDFVSDHPTEDYSSSMHQMQPFASKDVAASPTEGKLSEYERRLRSNSLFSALLNDPRANQTTTAGQRGATKTDTNSQYGHWMDCAPDGASSKPGTGNRKGGISISKPKSTAKSSRRASAPPVASGLAASLEADRKKREKEEKKEQKKRERLDKKEKKQQEKKRVEEEEEEQHVPGSGRPRSLSDPNLRFSLDDHGMQQVDRPDGWIGAYSPDSRKVRIERFLEKRNQRVWTKSVKYDVRKNFADSRLRVKGRFVKKEEESLMRELMSLT
jgi:CCT motif